MGLFNKGAAKLQDMELRRITAEEMAEMVSRIFIEGADEETLKKIVKTVKAGLYGGIRTLDSGSFRLMVTGESSRSLLGLCNFFGRDITMTDSEAKIFYEMPFFKYKTFRKKILAELKAKGIKC